MDKYYSQIRNEIINNEATRIVKSYSINKSDLISKYNIGKELSETGKHYGEGILKEYSKKLTNEFGKGYTVTNLKYLRRFYEVFSKGPTLSDLLTYSHYREIIWFDYNQINYYINVAVEQNLSVRKLRVKIKSKEYERLPDSLKEKLITKKEDVVITDLVKNPIIINNPNNIEVLTEKVLHKLIMEDLPNFLKQLGDGFTFRDIEYPIKVGNRYNYIDLLLYNYIFKCFCVVELKITELKKEHKGQIEFYMNYIDENKKGIDDNKTIGIIICKEGNEYIKKYFPENSIIAREYEIKS